MKKSSDDGKKVLVHPGYVRVWHWLNALAVIVMIGSGWRIYNNFPIIEGFTFPVWMTIGGSGEESFRTSGDGGFGNALLWHFAAMWLLVVNNLIYYGYGLVSGRFARRLFPISPSAVLRETRQALTLKLDHHDLSRYNAVQRLMYLGVLLLLAVIVVSGLAVWKPVQFQTLTALFGGFQGARLVHFIVMAMIVAFVIIHVTLAVLVPRSLLSMFTGRVPKPAPPLEAKPPAQGGSVAGQRA